jgi:hypothetical protein
MSVNARLLAFFNGWRNLTRALEYNLVDLLAATSPWLAPLIPAYLAWRNMSGVLNFPWFIALAGAAVIETLGLSTVHTVFSLWDYNQNHTGAKTARAPVAVAVMTAVIYMTIVLVVNVLLEARPLIQQIAQALLSCLSVVASVTLAVRANHARRLSDQAEIRAEAKAERERHRQELLGNGNLPETYRKAIAPERDWRTIPTGERAAIRAMKTTREIMERYPGISERTARNWNQRAHSEGKGYVPIQEAIIQEVSEVMAITPEQSKREAWAAMMREKANGNGHNLPLDNN